MFKLSGCYTALITPFRKGAVDYEALRALVRLQLRGGVDGLVPCGSTGEAAALTQEEYLEVIRVVVEEAKGRAAVMPGVGTNSTEKSVEAVRKVSALGVNALLAIVPYYNKPTQAGMTAHFTAMAGATRLPVVLYNIPGRTGVNMLPATVAGLRKACRNIVGIKEASGNIDQVSEIVNTLDKDFSVMSGDDSLTLPMMAVGARGVISVVSNIAPAKTAGMCGLFARGDLRGAMKLHHELFPLVKALFGETNPIPVKYAARLLGLCAPEPRLPLTVLSADKRAALKAKMLSAGLRLMK